MNEPRTVPVRVDRRRYAWIASLVVPALVLIAYALVCMTGNDLFWWTGPIVVYGMVPLLDGWIGTDAQNPPADAMRALEHDAYYRRVLLAALPLQIGGTVLGTWVATQAAPDGLAWIGLVMTVGIVNGAGINTAHEWGHKREKYTHWLAKLCLAPTGYGHFFVEHNRGHHKNVATPEDPASARMGESYWAFLVRSVIGGVRSAWRLEADRLATQGRGACSVHNDNLQAWALSALLFAALVLAFGWLALPFLLAQAAYGFSLLEAVNYIEHYGLLRKHDATGRYERCSPQHSWNSDRIVSNVMLHQLQRHSDHHANPRRAYQTLRHFDDSPQLPAGYAALIPRVYFPWLWFALMDRRVIAHYGGQRHRANLQPGYHAP